MPLTYKDAGVDIDAGDAFVDAIGPLAASTHRPEVLGSLGGFSGLFRLDTDKYREPLLVAATDGVGTKLKLAFLSGQHETVGVDLVAMCVNDLVVCGAEPLFFLDYFATGKLEPAQGRSVVAGIAEGCRQAGCALLGGETAEMPGFYQAGEYDLAGFAVGVVDKPKLLGPERVCGDDVVLGLASSGLHSNGFSLVRKAMLPSQDDPERRMDPGLLATLLRPTRIYVRACLDLMARTQLHALAHITGGGLPGNLPRSLPEGLAAELVLGSWTVPEVFERVRAAGQVSFDEMLRTFNLGVGMIALLPRSDLEGARRLLAEHGIESWEIGRLVARAAGEEQFRLIEPAG
jgi:phosphoribosylformylglycinamidine cyclo-ligase